MINNQDFFSRKKKEIGIVSVVLIIISSFTLFFYQQNITEKNVRDSIFTQYKDRQIESTKIIAEHISSDLKLLSSILRGIADSTYLQQDVLFGEKIENLMQEKFFEINNVTKIDGLFIVDENNIITYHKVAEGQRSFVNIDISLREYIKETKNTLKPIFSNGTKGIDNIDRIALTAPIINSDTKKYIGIVGVEIPTESFFSLYGNIRNINSQFLVVYDKKGTLLAVGADKSLVGKNFFSETVQNFINHNPILINLTQNLLQGISGYGIYDYGRGERITTTFPIFMQDKPLYFIQIVTPTNTIYSEINNVLFGEKLRIFSLIVGTIAAIVTLIIFLIKWNIVLNNEVKKRTKELQKLNTELSLSNQELALANKELKVHDKMQKEFINVASHEIKTPIQAILTSSELFQTYPEKQDELLKSIERNAIRLQRLAKDLLDVTKIESQSLKLNKEIFNLNDVISTLIEDYKNIIEKDGKHNIKLIHTTTKENLLVEADKGRIMDVVSNLLSNAIKFTKEGEIFVYSEQNDNNDYVLVTVKDSGEGIDPEILPKMFSKFITKSFDGLGLGLYISKNIIEAHGGKMWAENNNKESGAIISFTLPIRI